MANRCFNCDSENVIWKDNYDFEDYGYEGDGIVTVWECADCGAMIEVTVANNCQQWDKDFLG